MATQNGSVQNFFEDFRMGQVFDCPTPRVLTDADRVAYIQHTGDRTPRFCNAQGLIHPLIVFHTVLGQTVRQISLNAKANLGYAEMRWHTPVHVGDEIRTTAQIVGLKENSSGETGIVYVKTTGLNQRGEVVLEYCRWAMVKKNRKDVTPYLHEPIVPTLAPLVAADQLVPHPSDPFDARQTGGTFFFEDYTVGERILHQDGVTVNSSDHMSFTRLYQNSARVHFDALLMNGQPLVYGGLPLSIGYAQSFNGIENRTGISAINAGTHANPAYQGDTLYSFTDVLQKADFFPSMGVLRLRMVVVKNEDPAATGQFAIKVRNPNTNKEEYNDRVVLDLDYWEPVARRMRG